MKARRVAAVAGIVSLAASFAGLAQEAAPIEKGKGVYSSITPNCSMCHSIAGKGNATHPLDGIGGKLSAEEIKAWIRTPREMAAKTKSEAKPPMMAYSKEKISDQDLDALVSYLLSLKAK